MVLVGARDKDKEPEWRLGGREDWCVGSSNPPVEQECRAWKEDTRRKPIRPGWQWVLSGGLSSSSMGRFESTATAWLQVCLQQLSCEHIKLGGRDLQAFYRKRKLLCSACSGWKVSEGCALWFQLHVQLRKRRDFSSLLCNRVSFVLSRFSQGSVVITFLNPSH